MKMLLTVFGLVLVLEGLPYATFPERMQAWFLQLAAMPARSLRTFGWVATVVGLILCYLTQRTGLLP